MLGDGGYQSGLENRGWVRAGTFTPEVAWTEALRQLHIEFRDAGAEALQALTRQGREPGVNLRWRRVVQHRLLS